MNRATAIAAAHGSLPLDGMFSFAESFDDIGPFTASLADMAQVLGVLLAPATPRAAPLISDLRIEIDGAPSPAREDLGMHTRPITFNGLPSLAMPVLRPGALPLGRQLIGLPGRKGALLPLAARLEADGITGVSTPECAFAGETT